MDEWPFEDCSKVAIDSSHRDPGILPTSRWLERSAISVRRSACADVPSAGLVRLNRLQDGDVSPASPPWISDRNKYQEAGEDRFS